MTDWYPGAWKVNQGGNGNSISVRHPENILHIAASQWNIEVNDPTNGSKGIAGWNGSTKSCHTYNDQYGNMQQYCSLFNAVNGTKDGNWRNRTHEAWNPSEAEGDLNASGYSAEQCERFSDFLAWDSKENGTLLQNMQDSRKSSHGVGAHRYGITAYNPWRQVGGEVWSTSSTKLCPGSVRVQQLDGIIRRAIFIRDHNLGTLPPGRINLKSALTRGNNNPPTPPKEWDEMATKQEITDAVWEAKYDDPSAPAGQKWPTSMHAFVTETNRRLVNVETNLAGTTADKVWQKMYEDSNAPAGESWPTEMHTFVTETNRRIVALDAKVDAILTALAPKA